ncbi:type II toxin-antitoxin system HicA family toxin [Patescibacteria group bacterium]|nr:type II toxin-antitoxin system HicA family toxin [Patescibacteria group bacterium]
MKRRALEQHLRNCGCRLVREDTKHGVWENPKNGAMATVPRHADIDSYLARKICRELGIEYPSGR